MPPSPVPLGGHRRGRSLAQAGDVGTSTRRCHDALGRAAWDVVIDLCPCGREKQRQVPPRGQRELEASELQDKGSGRARLR